MEKDIENIIRSRSYFELNRNEKELIKDWAANEEEFNQLKSVFQTTDLFKENQQKELNPTIKQRLDVRFKEKYDERRLVWYNKLWVFLWPENTSVVRKPLLQLAAVGIVVALVTPVLFQPQVEKERLAMNDKKSSDQTVDVEKEEAEEELKNGQLDKLSEKSQKNISTEQEEVDQDLTVATPEATKVSESRDTRMRSNETPRQEDALLQKGWQLQDEVAEVDATTSTVEPMDDNENFGDNESSTGQSVFAGAVRKSGDKNDEKSLAYDVRSDSDESVQVKKVDPENTIDLLSALY